MRHFPLNQTDNTCYMKTFELFWENLHIGTLTETYWDMRSSGDIVYHFNYLESPIPFERLAAFIRLSMKQSNYLENGTEEEHTLLCLEEEKHFMDFVDSTDWFLIHESGEKRPILCPIFHDNNEITWQPKQKEMPYRSIAGIK